MKTNNEWIIEIPFLLRNGLISLWVKRFFNLSPKAVIAKKCNRKGVEKVTSFGETVIQKYLTTNSRGFMNSVNTAFNAEGYATHLE